MKKASIVLLAIALLTGTTTMAQPSGFGIGAQVGEPTGLSLKFWNNPQRSLNIAAAWSMGRSGRLVVQTDYVFYNYNILDTDIDNVETPLYYGLGAQIRFEEDSRVGIRIPIGIDFAFQRDPLDIFLEVGPTLNVVPATEFEMTGGLGIHYYF